MLLCSSCPTPSLPSLVVERLARFLWPQRGGGASRLRPRRALVVRPAPPAARVAKLHRVHPAARDDPGGGGQAAGLAGWWVLCICRVLLANMQKAALPAGVASRKGGERLGLPLLSNNSGRSRCTAVGTDFYQLVTWVTAAAAAVRVRFSGARTAGPTAASEPCTAPRNFVLAPGQQAPTTAAARWSVGWSCRGGAWWPSFWVPGCSGRRGR